jgi:multiple sugar transport system substrate-binding protein
MKFNKRSILMVLLSIFLTIVLVACQPASQPTEEAGDTGGDVTTEPGEETGGDDGGEATGCGPVELQYWNPFTGPDGPYMGEMVDAFNAENGEEITVVMTTQSDYYTQISTAAASETLPDVAIIHADQVATWAYRGVLRPMDDLAAEAGVEEGDFPAGVWAAGNVNGTRYSIPLDIHPMTMFVNMDLLAEAGIEAAPTTGDEFTAAAEAMTQGDNNGFMLTAGFPVMQIFQQMLYQYGGTLFNEDGTEAAWNSEAGVQALQWMKDTQDAYSEPNLEVDAELNAFKGGTVGMIWNGIWQTTNVTGEGVEFDGQAFPVPQIGPNPAVWAGSHQFTLPTVAEVDPCKDAAAGTFISYMLENSVTWARAGQIPASNAVRASAEFAEVLPQSAIAPSVENAIFPPAVPGITDAFAPLEEAVVSIMSGTETDIQAALDNAKERADQVLEDNRGTYSEPPQP